jgi:hypothetical protein
MVSRQPGSNASDQVALQTWVAMVSMQPRHASGRSRAARASAVVANRVRRRSTAAAAAEWQRRQQRQRQHDSGSGMVAAATAAAAGNALRTRCHGTTTWVTHGQHTALDTMLNGANDRGDPRRPWNLVCLAVCIAAAAAWQPCALHCATRCAVCRVRVARAWCGYICIHDTLRHSPLLVKSPLVNTAAAWCATLVNRQSATRTTPDQSAPRVPGHRSGHEPAPRVA